MLSKPNYRPLWACWACVFFGNLDCFFFVCFFLILTYLYGRFYALNILMYSDRGSEEIKFQPFLKDDLSHLEWWNLFYSSSFNYLYQHSGLFCNPLTCWKMSILTAQCCNRRISQTVRRKSGHALLRIIERAHFTGGIGMLSPLSLYFLTVSPAAFQTWVLQFPHMSPVFAVWAWDKTELLSYDTDSSFWTYEIWIS